MEVPGTDWKDRGGIRGATDGRGNPTGLACVQTLLEEFPLSRATVRRNPSPAGAGLAALGRAPGLCLCSLIDIVHVNTNNPYVSAAQDLGRQGQPAVDEVIQALIDAFGQEMDIPAAARDLTIGQLRLMMILRRSGALSMHRVSDSFHVSQTGATGLVERIERHGYVERRHRSDDRRVVECHLTETGNELLDELSGLRTRGLQDALAALSEEQLADFERLLRVIASRR